MVLWFYKLGEPYWYMTGVPKGYASVFILPRPLHNQRFSRSVFTPAGKFEAFSNASRREVSPTRSKSSRACS